ncbi:uncharacterized protein LOC114261098 [Camellia sinensis]|uniref:uncharacterized protein LOC114261098 n=1 Tax=Camellia sinensis TaxID=4442 RepID=UPI001036C590|nr:uncharacterized protein LOC114261098 [Camellia sinensis]
MESDDDTDARMQEMCDDVAALAIEWQTEMNNNYVEAYRIASDYYKAHVLKVPCRMSILTGRAWILEMYNGHSGRFRYEMRMPKVVFTRLCATLVNDFGLHVLERDHGLHVEESVAIFIHVLKNLPNRELQERFQHSGETISRHFHNVLKAMKKFTVAHCRLPTDFQNSRDPYLQTHPQYLPFKDCLGALDGTPVPACIKESEAAPRILNIVTEDPQYNFPTAVDGRYYLVDSGYSNKKGFLAPYKGSHYHQPHFQRQKPRNRDELFNRAHTSLQSVIERTFGAWKSRWRFLHNMPRFDFRTVLVPLVAASMALHNFIRRNCEDDATIAAVRNAASTRMTIFLIAQIWLA